ncbi:MAG: MarR family transcriptional regulator [Gemmatimonadales bacterium]
MATRVHEEIQQRHPFPRRTEEAIVAITRTSAVLDHALGETLRPFGITPTQYNVLRILQGSSATGLCGREVGERLVSQVPDVSRLLDRMAELKLITRERDDDDRRHVTARIASRGIEVLRAAGPHLQALERQVFAEMDDDLVATMLLGLDAVRNNR